MRLQAHLNRPIRVHIQLDTHRPRRLTRAWQTPRPRTATAATAHGACGGGACDGLGGTLGGGDGARVPLRRLGLEQRLPPLLLLLRR